MNILNTKTIVILTVFLLNLLQEKVAFSQENKVQIPVKEDFEKKELQSFVRANQKVLSLQNDGEKTMKETVKQEGLSVERFNEIAASQQNPEKEITVKEEELQLFHKATQKLTEISKIVDNKMHESIEQENLDVVTYQEILLAYQNSSKVKQEIDSLLSAK